MKALTVRQPWAWAIAAGVKTVENRTRGTSYRGPLAIHAGKGWSVRGIRSELIRADWARLTEWDGPGFMHADPIFATGAVIAVAQLVDSHAADLGGEPHDECCQDQYAEFTAFSQDARDPSREVVHLVLRDVVVLDEPVRCRGALGFWNLPADVAEVVEALLAIAGAA